MVCSKCGYQNMNNAQQCARCGQPLYYRNSNGNANLRPNSLNQPNNYSQSPRPNVPNQQYNNRQPINYSQSPRPNNPNQQYNNRQPNNYSQAPYPNVPNQQYQNNYNNQAYHGTGAQPKGELEKTSELALAGMVLGIISIVHPLLTCFTSSLVNITSIVGLVLSIVSYNKLKNMGGEIKNAKAGIVLNAVAIGINVIAAIIIFAFGIFTPLITVLFNFFRGGSIIEEFHDQFTMIGLFQIF